jgi:hypothetical protein
MPATEAVCEREEQVSLVKPSGHPFPKLGVPYSALRATTTKEVPKGRR